MKSIEKSGKTVDEALQAALDELGVNPEDVRVEVLAEPARGMFGLGGKEALVRVSLPATDEEIPAYTEEADAEVTESGVLKEARDVLQRIFDLMDMDAEVQGWEEDGYIQLNAVGPDMGIIIGRQGQTLDAFQFIVNLIANRNRQERVRIIVDAESYRQRRKEALAEMAIKMAARAKDTGEDIVLSSMTPSERRVIHTILQDDNEVTTFSEGDEPYRRVVIRPL